MSGACSWATGLRLPEAAAWSWSAGGLRALSGTRAAGPVLAPISLCLVLLTARWELPHLCAPASDHVFLQARF